ncbi:hypothetical protein LDENG_00086960 [Lucifuga dentata]|nr:hypothetical protein LDENG_00086960 [Lucifuga dentata]
MMSSVPSDRCVEKLSVNGKKDQLQVSFDMLRDSLSKYQEAVGAAKTKRLSDIVSNCHRPCVLFSTINAVINPPTACFVETPATCENFLRFFCW